MNFNKKQPPVNMALLAKHIADPEAASAEAAVLAYAPPAHRQTQEVAINQVKTFGALPTKELDEIVAAAEAEIAALKADAQAIRDLYVKHTSRVAADIKRLQDGVRLSMDTMKALREQCAKLDAAAPIEATDGPPTFVQVTPGVGGGAGGGSNG